MHVAVCQYHEQLDSRQVQELVQRVHLVSKRPNGAQDVDPDPALKLYTMQSSLVLFITSHGCRLATHILR